LIHSKVTGDQIPQGKSVFFPILLWSVRLGKPCALFPDFFSFLIPTYSEPMPSESCRLFRTFPFPGFHGSLSRTFHRPPGNPFLSGSKFDLHGLTAATTISAIFPPSGTAPRDLPWRGPYVIKSVRFFAPPKPVFKSSLLSCLFFPLVSSTNDKIACRRTFY